ncbi:hypothetical protein [Deinococcus planocerae]|uniref:hypothetical protein n=1 Tax=Deinococcus planocerae TaxID=1737569 RepID=UPI0011AF0C43|nr:hypothetical protein [Deinococcus planocerae]
MACSRLGGVMGAAGTAVRAGLLSGGGARVTTSSGVRVGSDVRGASEPRRSGPATSNPSSSPAWTRTVTPTARA